MSGLSDTVQDAPRRLTTAEAAVYAGFSVAVIKRAALTGELRSTQRRPRAGRRFLTADIDAWMSGSTEGADPA